jgi:hypothetical protein
MWILVVVLIDGTAMFSYAEGFPYRDLKQCQKDAEATYYSHMATRPNPEAYVVSYCSEVPKGI